MKVALLAESFLPHMNGVTHSLLQVLRHLERTGHEALVIAPRAGRVDEAALHGARSLLLPSTPLPKYPQVRIAAPGVRRLAAALADFGPDVVHLASPFVLGWQGVRAAEQLGVPSVAVYQTDVPAYAARYGVPAAAPALERHVARLHGRATLTLAPSSAALARLEALEVERTRLWRRGVDLERFRPDRRDDGWRRTVAPAGETIVGYVGRLAPEKQVEDLIALRDVPGVRLVIVGDGPARADLERLLPDATFTGFLGGDALAAALASFDVFVHPGESETFCQTIQEAHASGVPVVATGAGGPLDLVRQSVDGWLYRPGDLEEFAARVADLAGDAAKRRAFGRAARAGVAGRGWSSVCEQLLGHYREARAVAAGAAITAAELAGAATSAEASAPSAGAAPSPSAPLRFVACGDSLTEGLCDEPPGTSGEYRGWADRLAMLLAMSRPGAGVEYANLAVRSRRIRDVVDDQLPAAIALGADLIGVFVGSNDLVRWGADPDALADRLATGVHAARRAGCRVLLVAPVLPDRWEARALRRRFARFGERLGEIAASAGASFVDAGDAPELRARSSWADDRVHLNSAGHRALAYAAASVLEVPDAAVLADLEFAAHDGPEPTGVVGRVWLTAHALPWVLRRLRGRRAGDGRSPKQPELAAIRTQPLLRRNSRL